MIFILLNDLLNYLQEEIPDRTFQLNYLPGRDVVNQNDSDSIYITLLNISEDVSSKIPYVYHQDINNKFSRQNPPLILDLSIMISSFFKHYDEGLKAISAVINKLASKTKFKTENSTFTISLYNISMEQNSNLWQALSTNVLPNVVYKIRYIPVNPELNLEADLTGEVVEVNVKTKKL